MRKLLALLTVIGIISVSYILYSHFYGKNIVKDEITKILEKINITIEEKQIVLDNLYIYGNNLNLEGNLNKEAIKNIELVIESYDEEIIPLVLIENNENITFKINEEVNNGLLLDKYTNILYLLFLKVTYDDNTIKYYSIQYPNELIYYTITNQDINYKIMINNNNKYNTLSFYSTKTKEETYDIILDPGHGGIDSGACLYKNRICERDYTPIISKKIKEKLQEYGVKVAYTWDIDNITNNNVISNYGINSRTGRAYETHAKYLFSIHLNSSSSRKGSGFEIYTPYNIDYSLAELLRNNLSNISNHSSNISYRVYDGIYTRTFTTYDLIDIKKERDAKKLEPLNISTKTNYYFMIRETAGEIGDAYVDGTTNSEGSINPYRDYKVSPESYILELGYISNSNDVKHIEENMDSYVDAIVNSITTHLDKEKSAN